MVPIQEILNGDLRGELDQEGLHFTHVSQLTLSLRS